MVRGDRVLGWLDAVAAVRFGARVLPGAARLAQEKLAPGRLDHELSG